MLSRIYGRAVDSVVLPSGGQLLWPFFHEILGSYNELRQWRIIQTDMQHLKVQLVIPGDNLILLERIKTDLRCALPEEIELRMERVDTIPIRLGEKVRMIISQVSVPSRLSPQGPARAIR
jgi:hypothetical protein